MDKKTAEAIAKTFTDQEFDEINGVDMFPYLASAMEFTRNNGHPILLDMVNTDGHFYCEVSVGDKVKQCYDYHNYHAIADAICEIA